MGVGKWWLSGVALLELGALGCAGQTAAPVAVPRTDPATSAQPTRPAREIPGAIVVEISAQRVLVDKQELATGATGLRQRLSESHRGEQVLQLRAQPDVDDALLARVLRELAGIETPRLSIDIGDVQLELVRGRRADEQPAASVVALVYDGGRALWSVDNVSGSFEDLGTWSAGDGASEQSVRAKLLRACSEGCHFVLDVSGSPVLEALRDFQRIGSGLKGSLAVNAYATPARHAAAPTPTPAEATPPDPSPSATPRVRLGATRVSGRLPPVLIQTIIRASFQRFRVCYEAGLGRDPELRGRVVARFVIGRDGAVSNVADGGSAIADAEVRDCALKAFYGLKFPSPIGGIVTVVYPIRLEPG